MTHTKACILGEIDPGCVCERQFHTHEGRAVNDCVIWNWIMGFDPGWATEMYLLDPLQVVCHNLEEQFGMDPYSYYKMFK